MKSMYIVGSLVLGLGLLSCGESKKEVPKSDTKEVSIGDQLKEALTLHASFDKSVEADFAKGDANLYTVMNRKALDSSMVGLKKDSVQHIVSGGKYGGALSFEGKTRGYIYYKSKDNLAYNTTNWNGAISFWLKLNPDEDLRPGYCDPIQITDVSYNDASIWVDFNKVLPRAFRLGVIEDRDAWNPEPEGPDNEDPKFINMLLPVENPPFNRQNWTHIVVNFSGLNSMTGKAELYLNGELQGVRDQISNPFTWELENSNIYLGLSYIGLFDELKVYDRALSKEEIQFLYE